MGRKVCRGVLHPAEGGRRTGPLVLVAHSFSGTIARLFAGEHPDEVKGIVFVDVLTPELRAQMTPEEWKIWKRVSARPAAALAAYPDLERQDFDQTLDQTAAAAALRPMPVVVLTASHKFIDPYAARGVAADGGNVAGIEE
jgi:pimeloyl-ACP methyl ester carboxylesterase